MNICKRIASVLLIVVTLVSFLSVGVVANAATPATKAIEVYQGQSVSVDFSVLCLNLQGNYQYDANYNNIFTAAPTVSNVSSGLAVSTSTKRFMHDGTTTNVEKGFSLVATVKSNAAIGSTCTFTFTHSYSVDSFSNAQRNKVKTVTVKVVDRPATSTPTTSTPVTSTPVTSTPATSTPATSTPATSTPATSTPGTSTPTVTSKPTTSKPATSSTPAVKLDLVELNAQIGTAQGLNASDYTVDSWAKVKAALNAAIAARKANKQADVDAAANALKDAVAALVKIDGTQLQKLVDSVNDFLAEDAMAQVRDAVDKALDDAAAALKSGKQSEINAAYNNLAKALENYKNKLAEISKGETIEVEKPVEVDPDGPFCNIWLHKLWLVLLIISLCANVVFIVLTVRYFVRRRKKLADDMPLVDYNINED